MVMVMVMVTVTVTVIGTVDRNPSARLGEQAEEGGTSLRWIGSTLPYLSKLTSNLLR